MNVEPDVSEISERGGVGARRAFSRVGFAAAMLLLVPMAVQLTLCGLWKATRGRGLIWAVVRAAGRLGPIFSSLVLVHLLGGLCFYLWVRTVPKAAPRPRERWPWYALAACAIIGMSIAELGNLLGTVVMYLLNRNFGTSVGNQVQELVTSVDSWQILIGVVVAAPIAEEWMFRVLLLDRIRPFGDRLCILASGLMFGLIHGNLYQFFYAFVLGSLLAYIYLRTGRPGYVIGLHMCFNFLGGFAGSWLLGKLAESGVDLSSGQMPALAEIGPGLVYLLLLEAFSFLMIGCTVAGVVLAVCLRRHVALRPAERRCRIREVFGNPGMALLGVAAVGAMLMGFL